MKRNKILIIFLLILSAIILTNCGEAVNDNEKIGANTINLGAAAVQGEWVYHFKLERNPSGAVSGLYKTRLDNSESILLSEDSGLFLTAEDDWIYYSTIASNEPAAIYKAKSDGSERIRLSTDSIMYSMSGKGFQLDGEWFYYLSVNDDRSLQRVKTDGSTIETLAGPTAAFYVHNGWIYYNTATEDSKLYRIKTDGSENSLLIEDNMMLLEVSDDHVWASDEQGNGIIRTNLDGSDVINIDLENVHTLVAKDEFIYYITQSSGPEVAFQIYRANNDGSGQEMLADDTSLFIETSGEWIYYISVESNTYSFWLSRMNNDGSNKETLKAEGIFVFVNW